MWWSVVALATARVKRAALLTLPRQQGGSLPVLPPQPCCLCQVQRGRVRRDLLLLLGLRNGEEEAIEFLIIHFPRLPCSLGSLLRLSPFHLIVCETRSPRAFRHLPPQTNRPSCYATN